MVAQHDVAQRATSDVVAQDALVAVEEKAEAEREVALVAKGPLRRYAMERRGGH